ncbi:MAG: EamA family transporter [Bacteroidetes bacterium]|nr:EamA family transporter [Bacteroidota bacterium]
MKNFFNLWQFWAFLSALFAAFTAIFAKIGIAGINSDFATFIRTIVIFVVLTMILFFTNQFQPLHTLSQKSIFFLILSGIATGASWIAYFRALKLGNASQVAPIDKLSVVFVALFGLIFLGEQITFAQWVGIGLIAAGAIVIAVQ